MQILLEPRHVKQIQAHGEKTFPEECCGFIIGRREKGRLHAEHLLPTTNHHRTSRQNRYIISPQEYLRAEKFADTRGLALLGFYHSHPDHPAHPSVTDLEHAWPNLAYLIVAVNAGKAQELNAFMLNDHRKSFRTIAIDIK